MSEPASIPGFEEPIALRGGARFELHQTGFRHSRGRKEAFTACETMIDRLKERVPIWKKEVTPDGEFWVEGEKRE